MNIEERAHAIVSMTGKDDAELNALIEKAYIAGAHHIIEKACLWFGGDIVPAFITSVHKLQHALRLCKRNELADNFKLGTRK